MQQPIRVLFVCDGGTARSVMAAAILQTLGGEKFDVHSAGLEVEDLNPLAIKVMQEISMPVAGQRIHHINDYEDMQFDYVIALCTEAKNSCLAFPRDFENLHWRCSDPTTAPGTKDNQLTAFRATRDELQKQIEAWLPRAQRHA